ncbi:MAG: DUF1638 domain-containing protein [Candidatus Methanospirare jalkutatii]|nr:MAG: DUF1638 domain-containing protein [Candidatus Methanospirare jalkutatii]
MRVGVLACEMLCRELRETLKSAGIRRIFIVSGEESTERRGVGNFEELKKRFLCIRFRNLLNNSFAVEIVKSSELKKVQTDENVAVIRITELKMHDNPHLLIEEIEKGILEIKDFVDFILLGYGLCGCSAKEVSETIRRAEERYGIPVEMPSDEEGFLNNCIEIALGRDKVRSILAEEKGTFFMTPAGAYIAGEPHVVISEDGFLTAEDTANIIKILQKHYKQVVKIFYSEEDLADKRYSAIVERFARRFRLRVRSERGSADALKDAFERALRRWQQKAKVEQRKDERRRVWH